MNNKISFTVTIIIIYLSFNCSIIENDPISGSNEQNTNLEFEQFLTTQPVFESFESSASEEMSTDIARNVILSLTCVAENDTTGFVFNYAENIHDGRGITFGIIGFTSGTFDGTMLLKRIQKLNPSHVLCAYIPAFEHIDGMHDDGHVDDVTGLDNFIKDFNKYGNDEVVKKAQMELLDELYWDPAMEIAADCGLKLNISKGQIYDATVRHGEDGAEEIARRTTNALSGSPATGKNEIDWLKQYFIERKKYYKEEDGETGVIHRIDIMYQGILDSGNYMMAPPFSVKCYDQTAHLITGGQLAQSGIRRR
jgi:chitosanase